MREGTPRPRISPPTLLLAALFALEGCALVSVLAMHRRGERELLAFLGRPPGVALIAALCGVVGAAALVVALFRRTPAPAARRLKLAAAANLLSVVAAFGVVEAGVRALAIERPGTATFGSTVLLPRSWDDVAAHARELLARASAGGSFLVHDDALGWTVGRARQSSDYNRAYVRAYFPELRGRYPKDYPELLYASSVEGLRSASVGAVLADTPARQRVAAVGDSFTFGLEVSYEQTWAHHLELLLGRDVQVLNFGVDGYGVDQSYLRYERDVVPWRPDVVILAVIGDDLRRSMGVYGFLTFPGGEIPFPKPRFVLRDGRAELLAAALPSPEFVFSRRSIDELPFVEYDRSYEPSEWKSRLYDSSHALRLMFSLYPVWHLEPSDEELRAVNREILRAFVERARAEHSTPLVVILPTAADFASESLGRPRVLTEILDAGVPHLDLIECLRELGADERFLVLHYTPAANAAIASCLKDRVAEALQLAAGRDGRSRTARGSSDSMAPAAVSSGPAKGRVR